MRLPSLALVVVVVRVRVRVVVVVVGHQLFAFGSPMVVCPAPIGDHFELNDIPEVICWRDGVLCFAFMIHRIPKRKTTTDELLRHVWWTALFSHGTQ